MKKFIALLLALVMVMSLAACGTKTAEEPAAEEPAAETEAEVTDSVNVSGLEPGALPIVPEGEEVTLTIGLCQQSNVTDYYDNDFTKWLEEKTGVKLEFVIFPSNSSEAQQKLNLMIAGGEKLPDLMLRSVSGGQVVANELGEEGYFLDLKPYFDAGLAYWFKDACEDQDMVTGVYDEIMAMGIDPNDGGFYGYPYCELDYGSAFTADHVSYNEEWLKQAGMEMPTTIEEVHDALTYFVNEDPNGNGKKDEMGIAGMLNGWRSNWPEYFINAYIFCNDYYLYDVNNGVISMPYTADEYRMALRTLNQWYEEGLINPISFTMTESNELKPIWTPDDGVAICGAPCGYYSTSSNQGNQMVLDYEPASPLKAETDKGGYPNTMSYTLAFTSAISADCENPEVAFRFVDFLSSFEANMRMRYGVEGREWDYSNEGEDVYGYPATYICYDEGMWSNENNVCWHAIVSGVMSYCRTHTADVDDGNWNYQRWCQNARSWLNYADKEMKSERFFRTVYNQDEQNVISEYQSLFKDFMFAARSQFITGELDIDDDAVWQTYLDECEANGFSELIAVTQSAWDRTNGK